jgi:hypothetical protein
MAVPVTKVYIFFDSAYVDVTQYVSSVSVNRGKSRELDRYTAGNASVTFHNDSRIFDPYNTSSSFYPNVVPRKLLKIETSNVPIFTGYIDDWDLTYDISGKSFASASVVDGFLRLSAAELDSFTATSQISSDRITAILNRAEVNWPVADRSIETGLTTLQADVVPENENALQYLQLVETTENGKLFVNAAGQLTFKNRATVPPLNASVVFADDATANAVKYNKIAVVYGSENLYNRVTITRAGGTPQVSDSSTSQTRYGVAAFSLDGLLLTSDTEASYLAAYLVGLYDEPELRINEVTVLLHDKTSTQVTNILNLEIASVVRVKFTPNRTGSQIDQYGIIIGIKHNVGIDTHSVTFELATTLSSPLILDDAIYGRLGGSLEAYDTSTITYDSALVKYDGTEGYGYVLGY